MPTGKKITDSLRRQVLNLRAQGYTYLEIGKMTDSTAHMVVEICRNAVALPTAPKQGMTDLWIMWDNLNTAYRRKYHV